MKNPIIVPVVQVVELGKATILTLGVGSNAIESNGRPVKPYWTAYNPTINVAPATEVVELGSAAKLTLGGQGIFFEYGRPNAKYRGF
jgi:hypothetical protein